MIFAFTAPNPPTAAPADSQATLTRLIGNLRGFVYRRRHDARWTMDFISDRCRDVIGYDPHRFIANGSIAFSDLIARPDRQRVNETVRLAVLHRHRVSLDYRIRTAHGALIQVEDRLTPIFDSAGEVVAIEGVVEQGRSNHGPFKVPMSVARDTPPAGLPPLHSLN